MAGDINPYDPWVAQQVHAEAARLRGAVFDTVHMLEFGLDSLLLEFFGIQRHRDVGFRAIVLGRLGLRAKLGALRNVLAECDLLDDNRSLLRTLDAVVDFRNMLAHSPAGTSEGTFTKAAVYYLRTSGGRMGMVEVSLDDLEAIIRDASEATAELHTVTAAVAARTSADSASEADLQQRLQPLREALAEGSLAEDGGLD